MKISLKWINDFVNVDDIDPYEIANILTVKTAETEGVYVKSEFYSNILTAKIENVEKINEEYFYCKIIADKEYSVISGAPNTRKGIITFFVKPGGKIDGNIIKEKKIANNLSQGMLLSGKELGINNNHSGIIELNNVEHGIDINNIIDFYDSIIEIDNKSLTHRPDLWGIYGFAREIAAILNRPLKEYKIYDINLIKSKNIINIDVKNINLCYRYTGIKIGDIKVEDSPLNIQTRLMHTDHVPHNIIVDLTNYIMTEIGQPMHAFDGNKINKIVIDTLKEDKLYITLDGIERKLKSGTLMIMNDNEPVAIAGIMGGGNSEISDSSTSLFLESANFNAANIRKTSTDINLRTDSSQRFEKSLDPENTLIAILRYIELLKKYQKNVNFTTNLIDKNYNPFSNNIINTSYSFIRKIVGANISDGKIKSILTSLHFDVNEMKDNNIEITIPSFRNTKDISIPEDIVEEVARIYGYDNIVPQLPKLEINIPDFNKAREIEHKIKDILTYSYNMNEIDSYIWFDNQFLKKIKFEFQNAIQLRNPISSNNTHLRTTMITNLLKNVYENLKFYDEFSLYDIGSVFIENKEINKIGIIIVNKRVKKGDEVLFLKLKEIVNNIYFMLNSQIPNYTIPPKEYLLLNPAIMANININTKNVGYIGTIHPSFNNILDKKVNIAFVEIDLFSFLIEKKNILFKKFSQYPLTELDFSILKPDSINFRNFDSIIKNFENSLLKNIEFITIYEGKNIEKNYKSVTYRFTIGNKEKTLTSEDINNFKNKFIEFLKTNNLKLR